MENTVNSVIVIGAGPVGLLTALILARSKIRVDVLECNSGIDQRPRGVGYGPSAVKVIQRAGIIEKVRQRGITHDTLSWHDVDGHYSSTLSGLDDPNNQDRGVILQVHQLTEVIYDELKHFKEAQVHWSHRFTGLVQDDAQVTVTAETEDNVNTFVGDFVIGADGAGSAVRKALFGRSFPGKSWDVKIVASNIRYEGFDKVGWPGLRFSMHPEDWFVSCRLEEPGLWRVAYGESSDVTNEQLKERRAEKYKRMLPGSPSEGDYDILNWNPYVMHQRCAERMTVGRVLLAGDAAHLCNPMGGLGLTGGIADVGSLVDCLLGINEGKASIEILQKYDEKRREIYYAVTDLRSRTNLQRIMKKGEISIEADKFLQELQRASQDPVLTAELIKAEDSFSVDMTQFYDKK